MKNEEILPFEHNKYLEYLESIVLSEIRASETDTARSLYVWTLKQKQTISEKKSRLVVARGRVWGGKGIGQMWT